MATNIGNMKALADQLKQQKLLQARQAKAFETFEFPEEEGDNEGDEEEDVAAFSQEEEDETYNEQELVEEDEQDAEEESDEEYVEKKTKSKKRKPQEENEEEINVITDEVEEKKPKAEKPKQKKEKRSEKKKKRRENEAAFSECYLCLKEPARGAHMRKCPVCDQVCCKACRKSRQCRECYKKTGVLGKKKVRFEDEEISKKKQQAVKREAEESDEQTEDEEPKAKRQKKATSKKQEEEEEELDMGKNDPDYWKDIPVEERVQIVDRKSGFGVHSESNPLGAWTYNAVFKPKYEVDNLCASSGFQCDGRRITRIINCHFMTNDNFNRLGPTEKEVKKKPPKHPRPNLPTTEEHQQGFLKRDRCRQVCSFLFVF